VNKNIIISYTILENLKKLKTSTHLCHHINQNWQLFFTISSSLKDPDPKFLIFNLRIRIGKTDFEDPDLDQLQIILDQELGPEFGSLYRLC